MSRIITRLSKSAVPGMAVVGVVAVAVLLALAAPVKAATRKHVHVDGNRTIPVHLIPLYDENVTKIRPDDPFGTPFSTRQTCGDCHDYEKIQTGWHFNSLSGVAKPGRPGEPWVLADDVSGTQLPLSYRGWKGTWKPEDVGLTQWDFVKMFGRHMPGGDAGEKEEDTPDPKSRWDISGKLEINCLNCHNAAPDQNATASVIQVARENFRWAATASSNLGIVKGLASRLPDGYELINGRNPDNPWAAAPEVMYNPARFDRNKNVFFDVTDEPPANRCYFCHSTIPADFNAPDIWQWDKDVHMAAGLVCTTCHRSGLDHNIVRGYEGERDNDPVCASLSCKGCHMGGPNSLGGRMGAPKPLHKGLPAVHLEKIACTGCHSGLKPQEKIGRVRTARANRLGIHGRAVWDSALPYVMAPVFMRNEQGKLEPREVMWPSYWGALKNGEVKPLPFDVATAAATKIRDEDKQKLEAEKKAKEAEEAAAKAKEEKAADEKPADGNAEPKAEEKKEGEAGAEAKLAKAEEPTEAENGEAEAPPEEDMTLSEQQITRILAVLASDAGAGVTPVYVAGGKVYQAGSGGLTASDHMAAQPYSWPLAHDVRPANEALGAGGCTDCHSDKSGFFYATVGADSPTPLKAAVTAKMYQFENVEPSLLEALEGFAVARMAFIVVGVVLAALLALALVHYGFAGLEGFLRGKLTAETEEV